MPEIRYYTVTQTREVKVSANSLLEAAIAANAVFNEKALPASVPARLLQPVRERAIDVREDR